MQGSEGAVVGAQLSSHSHGKRLAILVNGTRGDIQPLTALGSFLQASGFQVLITTNVDHVGFVEKFGVKAAGCYFDFQKSMREYPGLSEAMAAGNVMKALDGMTKLKNEDFPKGAVKEWEAIKQFRPDFLLYHPQCLAQGESFAQALKIPCTMLGLFPWVPTSYNKSPLGEPCCHYLAHILMLKLVFKSEIDSKMPVLKDMLVKDIAADEFWCPCFANGLQEWMQPIAPILVGISGSLSPIPKDIPPTYRRRVNLTGVWVISKEVQQQRLNRQDTKFGGDSLGLLSDFLGLGEPPVYMGWGSMIAISAEHMAQVAVRSLMKAGLRGIILGGYAQIEPKHLDGQPDSAELREYAAKNVLFVSTAPHEWLFPQCMATVHHGGAGTTAAALRAGVPSVVTPCMIDQFDNADMTSKSGAGIGLAQFHKLTPETLSRALLRCQTDEKLIRTAATLGEKLRREDGLTAAAQAIDSFLQEEVVTGQWAAAMEQRTQKRKDCTARPPNCLCFVLRALCGQPFS